jgi:hypothetical protein
MNNHLPLWNRTIMKFIGKPVSLVHFVFSSESSVTLGLSVAGPFPATRGEFNNIFPKPGFVFFSNHKMIIANSYIGELL